MIKLSKNVKVCFFVFLIITRAFSGEKGVPEVGENFVFSAKNQGFFSGYYNLSATCQQEGTDFRIFTEDVRVNDISISPINPDHILVATSSGLYVSNDAGTSWQAVNGSGDNMLPSENNTANYSEYSLPAVHCASINTANIMNEENWWCGYQFGPYRSSDNGLNWSIKTRGLPNYFNENEGKTIFPAMNNFKWDSRIVDFESNRDFFACSDAGLLYWASLKFINLSNGLPKTDNGWDHLSVFDFTNNADTAFIATEKGIYKGTFDLVSTQVSWIPLSGMSADVISSDYDINNDCIKLFLSGVEANEYVNIVDSVKSLYWIDKVNTSEGISYVELCDKNLYYNDATIFDTTALDYSVYDSRNVQVCLPSNVKALKILGVDSRIFFLSQTSLYCINSQDKISLIHNFGFDIYDLVSSGSKIYIATAKGLYSSDLNTLQQWNKESGQISSYNGRMEYDYDVRSVEINPSGDIYIGCYNGGVLLKNASSGEWLNLNTGLGHRDLNLSKVEYISKAFDSLSIHSSVTDFFGNIPDTDADGKMNLLLMDIQDYYYLNAGDGVTFIDGYYDPVNQLDPQQEPNSNGSDIIFIDSDPLNLLTTDGYAAIASHLAESVLLSREIEEEPWIVKGLGELAEFVCGFKDINYEYKMVPNNSLTTWNDINPDLRDYEFSYLVFLYLYEHYFFSQPSENYNKSIKAIVDCPATGITGINTCLENAGYSENFREIYSDIVIGSILDQVETNDEFIKNYQWENAKVNIFPPILLRGYFEDINLPYCSSIKNWSSIIYKITGMRDGYDWAQGLGDLLTFQGSAGHYYKVYNIFSELEVPDENIYLTEMDLDNNNWGAEDITQFGDPDDPYQTIYTIVVQCTDSAGLDNEGHFIISQNFDDYYSNPWAKNSLRGYFRYNPAGVQLDWDDVYLGSDDAKQEPASIEIDKMDAQSFKEYNYSKAVQKNVGGDKISGLAGFEGFNVYKTDLIEYKNVQELLDGPDTTFYHFFNLPERARVYRGEIEIRMKGGYSSSGFNVMTVSIDDIEIAMFVPSNYQCDDYMVTFEISDKIIDEVFEDQEVEIEVRNTIPSECDNKLVEICLRLYVDKKIISALQKNREYFDTDVVKNSCYGYMVTALFNGVDSAPTNIIRVQVPDVDSTSVLWTAVSNFGDIGDPNSPAGLSSMEWPGGSGIHYLWEGRFWVGAIVDGEKRVSHADYGNYEWKPSILEGQTYRPPESYSLLGLGTLEHTTEYDDLDESPHDTGPLNLKVHQHSKLWPCNSLDSLLTNTMLIEQDVVNIGNDVLNDVLVSWIFDCDVGSGYDVTSPNIDDLVDYEGWDGSDTDTDEEDIVENIDWNGNGILDGYDENGIPYGWEYVGSPEKRNPNYDLSKIAPDGFPDEFQVVITDSDTLVVSRMMSYMYDGDDPATAEDDTGEDGNVRGFIGLRLLYSPASGVYSHQWWNWEDDPISDPDKYDFMAGTHPACNGFRRLPHPFEVGAPVFDYRFVLTTGPFSNFQPNDTLHFQAGVVLGKGIEGLRRNSDALAIAVGKLDAMLPIEQEISNKPVQYLLKQNYPNPFNPLTSIAFELPVDNDVCLTVYNMLGQKVRTLVNEHRPAGYYSVQWDGRDDFGKSLGSGIYFYRIKAGTFLKTNKMILLK